MPVSTWVVTAIFGCTSWVFMVVRSDGLLVMIAWVKWSPGVILNGFGVFEVFGIIFCRCRVNFIISRRFRSTGNWCLRRAIGVRRVVVVDDGSFRAAVGIRWLGFYWGGFVKSI